MKSSLSLLLWRSIRVSVGEWGTGPFWKLRGHNRKEGFSSVIWEINSHYCSAPGFFSYILMTQRWRKTHRTPITYLLLAHRAPKAASVAEMTLPTHVFITIVGAHGGGRNTQWSRLVLAKHRNKIKYCRKIRRLRVGFSEGSGVCLRWLSHRFRQIPRTGCQRDIPQAPL